MKKRRPKRLNRAQNRKLIAGAAAAAVIFCAAFLLRAKPAAPAKPKLTAPSDFALVPTPSRPIARGEDLSKVQWTYLKWPKAQLTGQYVIELEQYKHAVALSPLPQLLPVPRAALSFEAVDANAVVEGIPQGMRAITVKVDVESAVEGWARSGNMVDVIVIRGGQRDNEGLESKVIAENVRILSAGRSTESSAGGATAPATPSTVTLLVNQEDALKIKTAASLGRLTFALRGTDDRLPTQALAMNQRALFGGGKARREDNRNRSFRGYAKGPDGEFYVLDDESRWLHSEDENLAPSFVSLSAPTKEFPQ